MDLAQAKIRLNLEKATILLVDSTTLGMEVLVQIVTGFGARTLRRATSMQEAIDLCNGEALALIITDADLADSDGYAFVQWLRRHGTQPNRFAPVLMVASHTPQSQVTRARDCGANFILAKPLTPTAVLERLLWMGREDRQYLACDTYAGPDRRFKNEGPPAGSAGRRKDDLPLELGDAVDPNLDQDSIDAMLKTRRVTL
jgi:CheY-like chemotaxis protein